MERRGSRRDTGVERRLLLAGEAVGGIGLSVDVEPEQSNETGRFGDSDQPARGLHEEIARRERYPGNVDGDQALLPERLVQGPIGRVPLQQQHAASEHDAPAEDDNAIVGFAHHRSDQVAVGFGGGDRHVAVATAERRIDLCSLRRQRRGADRDPDECREAGNEADRRNSAKQDFDETHEGSPDKQWFEISTHTPARGQPRRVHHA